MSVSLSHNAFEDCFALFTRASESPNGIEARFSSKGAAMHFRTRLHWARTLWRRQSMEINNPGDPEFGVSPFDNITIEDPRHSGADWWLRLRKQELTMEIREIGE
jgi:hypothetical protein